MRVTQRYNSWYNYYLPAIHARIVCKPLALLPRRLPGCKNEAMNQYLLSVWHDEEYVVDFSSEEAQRLGPQVGAFNDELMAANAFIFGAGMQPASTALVMHGAPNVAEVPVTEGPYSESNKQMGGFWIIQVSDDAAAKEWAIKAAAACEGVVELRAFHGEG